MHIIGTGTGLICIRLKDMTMATKQTINVGDKIYAILTKNGEILAKVEHSDFNDIFSIIKQLQCKAKSGSTAKTNYFQL